MSTSEETPGRRGTPGWVKLLLVLSLAGNLVVLGLVVGHSVRGGEPERRGPDRVIDWIVRMVPEERRDQAVAHFEQARERIAAVRAERREHLPEVVAAMQAEPFDPAALDAALDTMFDRRTSTRAIVRERLLTLLEQFSPEERAAFAGNFAARLTDRTERKAD